MTHSDFENEFSLERLVEAADRASVSLSDLKDLIEFHAEAKDDITGFGPAVAKFRDKMIEIDIARLDTSCSIGDPGLLDQFRMRFVDDFAMHPPFNATRY